MAVPILSIVRAAKRAAAFAKGAGLPRADLVTTIISRAVAQATPNVPGSAILAAMRAEKVGIRKQTFYQLFRSVKASGEQITRQQLRDPAEIIPATDMPTAPFQASMEFTYRLEMNVLNYDDKLEGNKVFWFSSGSEMAPEAVQKAFEFEHGDAFAPGTADWDSLRFTGAYRRGREV